MSSDTLCAAFQHTAAIDPHAVAVRTVGGTQDLTWGEYAAQVRRIAAGFAALGIGRGDTVALMMGNRVEFYPIDVGALHAGATSFSVYNTLPPEGIAHVLSNAGASAVVCEAQYLDRIRRSGAAPAHIVVLDGDPVEGTMTLQELQTLGTGDFDFEKSWKDTKPDDVATLIYTSGTTGNPKGVETTHANLLFEAYALAQVLPIEFGDRITSFMPSAHIADRLTALYLQIVFGTQVTVVAEPALIAAALPDCRPTIWGAVPRVWEKLKAAIELGVANEPAPMRAAAMRWALDTARKRMDLLRAGEPVPPDLAAEFEKADATVLSALRAKLGFDELKWAVSGAAPIPADTLAFFAALGLPISEIWGMSELTCIASISPYAPTELGTVGRLVPGMQMRLADDGELFVRGPLVMKGYRGEPEKTAEAIDADGWLATGDVMTRDDNGCLRVVDRKKELIINASGKNMSPANIENAVRAASGLIGTVVAVGDARPYVTALVTLDPDTAASFAAEHGSPVSASALVEHPDIIERVRAAIDAANQVLSRVEQVKRFRLLPTFWEPGGIELTLTMKLRRKPINEMYATDIGLLYTDPQPADVHTPATKETVSR
ncbi:fatty acid--CoA ligase FadD11 [Nocardia pseudovaccinii]|uniref:fatty acid--CoA ligase FadD11 n=1 Tax=Nocardia pseudovaccinii TaxID=189540 RepID=UPI0007A4EDFE|nr:fatty acid--CoA ligase FadD11 [Nocardia pseudovaccinii]